MTRTSPVVGVMTAGDLYSPAGLVARARRLEDARGRRRGRRWRQHLSAASAWGTVDQIRDRMQQHVDAGATGIVPTALPPEPETPESAWDLVEALA